MVRSHAKLPSHLYLTPPPPPPPSNPPSSYLVSSRYTSPIDLLHGSSSGALAVSDRIPGFKTSVAFLDSLRANLHLSDGLPSPSLTDTPDSLHPTMASSTGSLIPPSPLAQPPGISAGEPQSASTDDILPLKTFTAETEEDKIEGLRLIADSVAQQRQVSSKAIIFHPLSLAFFFALLGFVYQWQYDGTLGSYGLIATTVSGVTMTGLITVRWATGGYLELAEEIGTWTWLGKESVGGKQDDIVITKYGKETIGALALRGVKDEAQGSGGAANTPRKVKRRGSVGKAKGVIRAWTVKQRYRRKGIGEGLLEEAINISGEKGWAGPTFASDHANSKKLLPSVFNAGFDQREKQASKMLERVIDEHAAISSGSVKGKR